MYNSIWSYMPVYYFKMHVLWNIKEMDINGNQTSEHDDWRSRQNSVWGQTDLLGLSQRIHFDEL